MDKNEYILILRWNYFLIWKVFRKEENEITVEHSEEVKKIRRKIEEKLRQDFSEEKIISLAVLLDIETKQRDNNKKTQS